MGKDLKKQKTQLRKTPTNTHSFGLNQRLPMYQADTEWYSDSNDTLIQMVDKEKGYIPRDPASQLYSIPPCI